VPCSQRPNWQHGKLKRTVDFQNVRYACLCLCCSASPSNYQPAMAASSRDADAAAAVESRFAHLLEPIRDLASNWQIDIASELEEYLAELEHIRVQFDPSQLAALMQSQSQSQGGFAPSQATQRSLNFAQAALLIQGSACIYSRKVEYLYALLYQTLDALIDQKKKKNAPASSLTANGDDLDARLLLSDQEHALLDLDDTMVDGANIDLKEEDLAVDEELQLHASFAHEDSFAAQQQERQKTLIIRAPLSLLSDNLALKSAEAGGKQLDDAQRAQQALASAFKISACVMHSSGALLLEENERHMLQANDRLELEPTVVQRMGLTATPGQVAAALPFGSPRAILLQNLSEADAQAAASAGGDNVTTQLEDAFAAAGGGGDGFYDDDDHENEMLEHKYDDPEPEHAAAAAAVAGAKKSVRFAADAEEHDISAEVVAELPTEEDLWAQLDPHDNGALQPRPYRRGVTTRKPHVPSGGAAALSPDLHLHMQHAMRHANPAQAVLLRAISKNSVHAPFFAEFSSLFLREQEERKQRRKRLPKAAKAGVLRPMRHVPDASSSADASSDAFIALQDVDDNDDDAHAHDDYGGGGGFDIAAAVGDHAHDDSVDQWESGGVAGVESVLPSGDAADADLARLAQSYEDLCREHVDAYLKSAQAFLSSSLLSRRVIEWQDRLAPILEEEETHKPFDIHAYGRDILQAVDERKNEEQVVDFATAVRGAPRYEVCRMFLATLQLANAGNLEISRSALPVVPPSDDAAAQSVDAAVSAASMSLRLLSMDDHNLAALPAATAAEEEEQVEVAPAAAPPKPKGKRKHTASATVEAAPAVVAPGAENQPALLSQGSASEEAAPSKRQHTQVPASGSRSALQPLRATDTNRRSARAH